MRIYHFINQTSGSADLPGCASVSYRRNRRVVIPEVMEAMENVPTLHGVVWDDPDGKHRVITDRGDPQTLLDQRQRCNADERLSRLHSDDVRIECVVEMQRMLLDVRIKLGFPIPGMSKDDWYESVHPWTTAKAGLLIDGSAHSGRAIDDTMLTQFVNWGAPTAGTEGPIVPGSTMDHPNRPSLVTMHAWLQQADQGTRHCPTIILFRGRDDEGATIQTTLDLCKSHRFDLCMGCRPPAREHWPTGWEDIDAVNTFQREHSS